MQAFEIESQADQTPFTGGLPQATQRKLAKAQDFLDDADDRLHGAFSQTIDGLSDFSSKFIGHLFFWTGIFGEWFWPFAKQCVQIPMMRFAACGDIRFNAALFQRLDIVFAEKAIVQGGGLGFTQLRRQRIQRGFCFLFVIGMIGK